MKNPAETYVLFCRTANQFRTMRPEFRGIGRIKVAKESRKTAKNRETPRMQNNSRTHSRCNCWNSVAVMFDLRCSDFEFGCSESVGNHLVRDQGGRRFKSSL